MRGIVSASLGHEVQSSGKQEDTAGCDELAAGAVGAEIRSKYASGSDEGENDRWIFRGIDAAGLGIDRTCRGEP